METSQLYSVYLAHPTVQTDTRKLQPGELFFALSGPNFNGNTFADDALAKGAAYAVIDDGAYKKDERYIVVDDTLAALQALARHHREQFNIPFIAITGSNGKTTTKELIAAVLRKKYNTSATEGNLNNHIGVPLTLLKIKPGTEIAIIEMGANHQKEIEGYCKVALPTYGLITNCGKAHIEGFGGEEGVRKGKGELYDFLATANGTVFLNADLDYLHTMAARVQNKITYGTSNATYTASMKMSDVFVVADYVENGVSHHIQSQLVGSYNFPNITAAICLGRHFGVTIEQIQEAIAGYSPDNSRSQWLTKGTNKVIMDAYNANPGSMKAAITNFAEAPLNNKMLWLGGMKEMGDAELFEHTELVKLIENHNWKQVILSGKEFAPVKHAYLWFEDSVMAAEYIKNNPPHDSAILIKGSRGSKMERLLEALPG